MASVFGIVADLVLIGVLWRWKGLSATAPVDSVAAVARDLSQKPDESGPDVVTAPV